MRVVLSIAALALLAGCGGSPASPAGGSGPSYGTATLAGLCPQLHQAIDALVVSNPEAQRRFVAEVQRISDAGNAESRTAITPLLEAGRTLQDAGVGPGYEAAMSGIYPAQVAVNRACVQAGSPILHGGH